MVGPQPTGPSPGLADAVRSHAPRLHRTAVMLAGDASGADRLVTEVFRHAAGVWGGARPRTRGRSGRSLPGPDAAGTRALHDALLHELVRAYLRRPPLRFRDEVDPTPAWAGADAGDVLVSLRPRQRAAAVLRRVEGWSSGRVAEALHVPREKVARLVPRPDGLRTALDAVADRHARPPQEVVATVMAGLPTTDGRPAGAGVDAGWGRVTPPAVRRASARERAAGVVRRPWTWRLLAGAVALGLVVWVSVLAGTSGTEPVATADADTGTTLALADGTALPLAGDDLAERGWVLDASGAPPTDLEGLRLVDIVPIDLARATAPLRLDTQPRAGEAVFAVLWCDIPTLDANLHVPAARLGIGGESTTLPCAGTSGEPPVERLVPLPPATGRGRTTALVSWTGDVPGRGRAMLATYTEVGAGPAAGDTAAAPAPVARDGTVVLDGSGPAYQVQDRTVHHQRVRIGPGSTVTAWAGGPGEITVQVDDVVLTDDGEAAGVALSEALSGAPGGAPGGAGEACESEHGPGTGAAGPPPSAWRTADPELREGRWLVYQPGRARAFAVPEHVRPGNGDQRVVTVAVTTTLERRSWQVHVGGAEVVEEDRAPLAVLDLDAGTDAPGWIGGYRLAAAWKVPNDGIPHALVDPGLRPGRRFLLVDAPAGAELGAWGVVEPHVATTRGAAELTVVREPADAFDESVWRPGDQQVRVGASTQNILAGTGTGVLSATAPAAAGRTVPSTLLAYEPVPYGDFDFAAAPPMGVSVRVDEAVAPPVAGAAPTTGTAPGTVVVDRFTRADLDDDGQLTIGTELTGRTWLRLTTAGPGRVHVLEGGRPAVWLPEGWWTSWTAEPVVTEVRVVGTRGAGTPGQPFELRVEGYEEGFAVEVLARDGAGGTPGTT